METLVVEVDSSYFLFSKQATSVEEDEDLVDSGATASIIRCQDRFLSFSSTRVVLKGIGSTSKSKPPREGVLKPNFWGISRAIWYEKVKFNIIAVEDMRNSGWFVAFPPKDYIMSAFACNLQDQRYVKFSSRGKLNFTNIGFSTQKQPSIECVNFCSDLAMVSLDSRKTDRRTNLEIHRASGHVLIPPGFRPEDCPDCQGSRGIICPHQKTRPEGASTSVPLKALAGDFWGKFRLTTIRRRNILLVIVCDCCRFLFLFTLSHKSEVGEKVRETVSFIQKRFGREAGKRVVYWIRFDNEPVLQQLDKSLKEVEVIHSTPYEPPTNGTVERVMREVNKFSTRCMVGVDRRVFCYCLEYVGVGLNNMGRKTYPRLKNIKTDNLSPAGVLALYYPDSFHEILPVSRMRRFGCLVFYKIEPQHEVGKGENKWMRGIFLGYRQRDWLVGGWKPDKRRKGGFSFVETRTKQVRFYESILVQNIDWLRPGEKGIFVRYDKIDEFIENGGAARVKTGDAGAPEGGRANPPRDARQRQLKHPELWEKGVELEESDEDSEGGIDRCVEVRRRRDGREKAGAAEIAGEGADRQGPAGGSTKGIR